MPFVADDNSTPPLVQLAQEVPVNTSPDPFKDDPFDPKAMAVAQQKGHAQDIISYKGKPTQFVPDAPADAGFVSDSPSGQFVPDTPTSKPLASWGDTSQPPGSVTLRSPDGFWADANKEMNTTTQDFGSATIHHPFQTYAGAMASIVGYGAALSSWIQAGASPIDQVKIATGQMTGQDIQNRAEARSNIFTPNEDNPIISNSPAFKAGGNIAAMPVTPITKAINEIENPEVRAWMMGLLTVGGALLGAHEGAKIKAGDIKPDITPDQAAGVAKKFGLDTTQATTEADVVKNGGDLPGGGAPGQQQELPLTEPIQPPTERGMQAYQEQKNPNQGDLFSSAVKNADELQKTLPPDEMVAQAKVVDDADIVRSMSETVKAAEVQQAWMDRETTPDQRAQQINDQFNLNEYKNRAESLAKLNDQLYYQDQAFEATQPTALAAAFQRAQGGPGGAQGGALFIDPNGKLANIGMAIRNAFTNLMQKGGSLSDLVNRVRQTDLDPSVLSDLNEGYRPDKTYLDKNNPEDMALKQRVTDSLVKGNLYKYEPGDRIALTPDAGKKPRWAEIKERTVDPKTGEPSYVVSVADNARGQYLGDHVIKESDLVGEKFSGPRQMGGKESGSIGFDDGGGTGRPNIYVGTKSMFEQKALLKELQDQGIKANKSYFKPGTIEFATMADANKAKAYLNGKEGISTALTSRAGDTVRMYQGRTGGGEGSPWFTRDKTTAKQFGDVWHTDVPKDVVEAAEKQTGTGGVRLPDEYRQKAKFSGEAGETTPKYEVDDGSPNKGKFGQGGGINVKAFWDVKKGKYDLKNSDEYVPGERNPKTVMMAGRMNIGGKDFVQAMRNEFGKIMDNFSDWIEADNDRDLKNADLGGMNSESYRAKNPLISGFDNPSRRILSYFSDQIRNHFNMEHQLLAPLREANVKWNEYYGLAGHLFSKFKIDLFKKDVGIAVDMEKNPESWFNGKDYIPSVEDLTKAGMSPESAAVWRARHENIDKVWNMLEKAAAYAEFKMPPRVPGYLPHVFKGPWRVIGKIGDSVSHEFNYFSRTEQQAVYAELQKTAAIRPDIKWETKAPTTVGREITEMVKGLLQTRNMLDKSPALQQLVAGLYDSSIRGIVTNILDRNNVTKTGHLLERVNMEGNAGLSYKQIKRAALLSSKMESDVAKWYTQVRAVSEVLMPLDMAGFLPDRSNLQSQIYGIFNSFAGVPDHLVKDVDKIWRDDLRLSGMDPGLQGQISRLLRSGFSKFYLFGKPSYYIINFMQKTNALGNLMLKQAQGHLVGEEVGSITKTLNDSYFSLLTPEGRASRARALKYADENGYTDPVHMESLDPSRWRDPIAMAVERNTRKSAFMNGYNYYRQIMGDEHALAAAGNFANEVAVPYDGRVGRPIAFGRLPDVLNPLLLFAQYNMHTLAQLYQGGRLMAEAIPAKNPKAFITAASGVAGIVGMNMALGGLAGVAFSGSWDGITELLAKQFGITMPGPKQAARQLGAWASDKLGGGTLGNAVSVATQMGLVSLATRFDVSGSAQGPSFSLSLAGKEVIDSAVDLALLITRQTAATMSGGAWAHDVSKNDVLNVVKNWPAQWAEKAEYLLKVDHLSDIPKMMLGQMPDYSVGHDAQGKLDLNGEGGHLRTQAESIAAFFGGMRSLRESDENRSQAIMAREKEAAKVDISQATQLIQQKGYPMDKKTDLIRGIAIKYGVDPNALIQTLIKSTEQGNLTDEQRQAMGAANGDLEAKLWYQRLQQIKSQEATHGTR